MLQSLQATWKKLTLAQRAALAGVLVAVFGGILLVAVIGGQTQYSPLFRNMELADAGEVTKKLEEMKVPYRLADNGATVEVPAERENDLRVKLSSEGLLKSGTVGFDLFDRVNFGATDFTQQVNYQRALQGELERTIRGFDGVKSARVHLALPEKRLFSEQEEKLSASVQLTGSKLTSQQVGGIVALVASAVEGLEPEDVTVLDGEGNLISDRKSKGDLSADQADYQQQYERRVANELNDIAERVVGVGKAIVSVRAEFDWDRTETTSETFKPSGPNGSNLSTEERTDYERYQRPEGGPESLTGSEGRAGTSSNMQAPEEASEPTPAGEKRLYDKTLKQVSYAVSKVTEKRVVAPGKLRRVNVAVFLDQSAGGSAAALKNAFATAAGLDLRPAAEGGRADRIEVLATSFDKSAEQLADRQAKEEQKQAQTSTLVRTGGAVAIVVVLLVASLLLLKRLRPAPAPVESAPSPGPLSEPAVLDVTVGEEGADPLTQLGYQPEPEPESEPDLEELVGAGRRSSMRDRVVRLAEERPEDVARQLQIWLTE